MWLLNNENQSPLRYIPDKFWGLVVVKGLSFGFRFIGIGLLVSEIHSGQDLGPIRAFGVPLWAFVVARGQNDQPNGQCTSMASELNKTFREQQHPSDHRSENGQLNNGPIGWKLTVLHQPITRSMCLVCVVGYGQAHIASPRSHPFHFKLIDPPIPEISMERQIGL